MKPASTEFCVLLDKLRWEHEREITRLREKLAAAEAATRSGLPEVVCLDQIPMLAAVAPAVDPPSDKSTDKGTAEGTAEGTDKGTGTEELLNGSANPGDVVRSYTVRPAREHNMGGKVPGPRRVSTTSVNSGINSGVNSGINSGINSDIGSVNQMSMEIGSYHLGGQRQVKFGGPAATQRRRTSQSSRNSSERTAMTGRSASNLSEDVQRQVTWGASMGGTDHSIRRHKVSTMLMELDKARKKDMKNTAQLLLSRLTQRSGSMVQPERGPPMLNLARELTSNKHFDAICAVAIICNAALLGAMSNQQAAGHNPDEQVPFVIATKTFSVWFFIELSVRLLAEGCCYFFIVSPQRGWNLFDTIVCTVDLVDLSVELAARNFRGNQGILSVLRTLRVLRIARALRIVRLARVFKELRLMVLSMMRSGLSLLWSMVLLSIIIYIFGIFLMQSIGTFVEEGNVLPGILETRFASVPETCYTLFMAVSGGISWVQISDPLIDIHWTNGIVLCFFVFFTIFAMLNIITGIFVETAISSVHSDTEEVIHEEMSQENSVLRQLKRIFEEADKEQKGEITQDRFEEILKEDRARHLMTGLGLEVNDARMMFNLIDLDHSGTVTIDEFLVACMRLRGGAKSVDLVTLMYENKRTREGWSKFSHFVENQFRQLKKSEERNAMILESILHMVNDFPPPNDMRSDMPTLPAFAEDDAYNSCI